MTWRLPVVLALALQLATDPTLIEFTASADHHALANGVPIVSTYRLDVYRADNLTAPVQQITLGKPTPDANLFIRIPLTLSTPLSPGVVYQARIAAVGPGGESPSTWSNQFAASSTGTIPPGALTGLRLVTGLSPGVPGLTGQYFPTMTLTGTPVVRVDPTINFYWGTGGPGVGTIGADLFSVRWTGTVTAPVTETVTFYTQSDDGVRLTVGGTQLVNNWTSHSEVENSGARAMVAGQALPIVLEWFENGGDAVIRLLWSAPSIPKAVIPASALVSQ
jgi:PA14 domain